MGSPIFFDYRANPNMIDLINQGGQAQADFARRQAEMFAGAFQGVGQAVGGAIQQHQEQKQQSKNEQALLAAMDSWDDNDPQESAKRLVRVAGPEGLKLAQGYMALRKNAENDDPKTHLQTSKAGIAFFKNLSPEGKAQAYPRLLQSLAPTGEKLKIDSTQVPMEYGPEAEAFLDNFMGATDAYLGTKAEKVEAPKKHLVEVAGPDGKPMMRLVGEDELAGGVSKYVASPKADKPNYEYRDTGDAIGVFLDGKLIRKEPKGLDPQRAAAEEDDISGMLRSIDKGEMSIAEVPAKYKRAVTNAAKEQGTDTRPRAQREIDGLAASALTALDQIEAQAKKTMTATTGVGAKIQGGLQRLGAKAGLAEETQAWDAQMAKLSLLARQLGEKGALSDPDIERVVAGLPALTEKTSLRDRKLKEIRDIVEAGLRQKVSDRVKFKKRAEEDVDAIAAELALQFPESQ